MFGRNERSDRGDRGDRETKKKPLKRLITRKRSCRFCVSKEDPIDFKRVKMLGAFLTERCKIVPRRMSGNCQFHQNRVVESIKRARHLAMMPYTITHVIRD